MARSIMSVHERPSTLGLVNSVTETSHPSTTAHTHADAVNPTMRLPRPMTFVGLGTVGTIVLVATWLGTRREQRALVADTERLIAAEAANAVRTAIGEPALADVPAPVARYLRLAIRAQRQIDQIRITQRGTLRTDAASARWMRFDAEHLVVPAAAGFLWDARVQVAPLIHVRVRDALIDGRGSGRVALMSAWPVSAAAGGMEMNSGSLHRYLAEAVWYPTALLPSPHLQWSAIDATSALATLTSHDVSVSLEFRFAPSGEVMGIFTPARWGTFAEGFRQLPWEGHFRSYREQDGILVPMEGDVGWYIDGEWRAVWKGSVVDYTVRMRD